MKHVIVRALSFCFVLATALTARAENVISDDVSGISREEMQATVERWPADMRAAAANDLAVRKELATLSLAAKKIADVARQVTPESDPEFYWDLKLQVQMLLRRMYVQHYLDNLDLPDWEPLARERYAAQKEEHAKVDERRLSSHILFSCTPQKCEYEDVNKLAAETLAALRGGADFAEMVEKHSDDRATKVRDGEFRWVTLGQPEVAPSYTAAVFEIENIGDYAEVTSTKFGLHIIRLDGIEPAYYKPYEEVKAQIIAALEKEYRQLAAMDFDRGYAPVGDFFIDEAALEEMLAPYKSLEAEAATPGDSTIGSEVEAGQSAESGDEAEGEPQD